QPPQRDDLLEEFPAVARLADHLAVVKGRGPRRELEGVEGHGSLLEGGLDSIRSLHSASRSFAVTPSDSWKPLPAGPRETFFAPASLARSRSPATSLPPTSS